MTSNYKKTEFNSFSEFYPYYLGEHQNRTNKRLHFIGTSCVMLIVLFAIFSQNAKVLFLCPLVGYGNFIFYFFKFKKEWLGLDISFLNKINQQLSNIHCIGSWVFLFIFFSLIGDFRMWFDIATGKIIW
jgi:hypothetical protein